MLRLRRSEGCVAFRGNNVPGGCFQIELSFFQRDHESAYLINKLLERTGEILGRSLTGEHEQKQERYCSP